MSVRTYENRETKRRNADVKMRVEALHEALDAGRNWLSTQTVTRCEKQLAIARGRLRQSLDHTVIVLAGSTGAGKTSLINTLAGQELGKASPKRPTTSQALAAVWDSSDQGRVHAGQLLDWLGVGQRHYLAQAVVSGEPNGSATPRALGKTGKNGVGNTGSGKDGAGKRHKGQLRAGLIVVDLPDFDSVVTEHRVRADHLTERADLIVWVTDPQKYADAVFHQEYLAKFREHSDMLVVLNQVDRLETQAKNQCLADIKRLLAKDGVVGATVLATSTKTGEGISELQALLEIAASRRAAQANSLVAELRACGQAIADECGRGSAQGNIAAPQMQLIDSLAQAAGVPEITDAAYRSALRRSHIATGWPVTAWFARFRADPLRRFGIAGRVLNSLGAGGLRAQGINGSGVTRETGEGELRVARTSCVTTDPALSARANLAVREYVEVATAGGPRDWVLGVKQKLADVDLSDSLDAAVAHAPSLAFTRPAWWTAVTWLHRLLLLVFVAGAAWLTFLAIAAYLRIDVPNEPQWMGFPIPTLMTFAGLLLGVFLGLMCRIFSVLHARRAARRVGEGLRSEIETVVRELIVKPVKHERDLREACVLAALVASR